MSAPPPPSNTGYSRSFLISNSAIFSMPNEMQLVDDISKRIHRDVDVVDLRRVGDVLRREVLEKWTRLVRVRPAKSTRLGSFRHEPICSLSRRSSRHPRGFPAHRHRLRRMSEETVAQKITSLQRCVSQARVA